MPMQAGGVPIQMGTPVSQAGVPVPTAQNQNTGTPENASAVALENIKPSNNAQNGSISSVLSVDSETTPPTLENPVKRNSDGSTAIVEKSVENVENVTADVDSEDDSYSVPDFMADMIDSCL